MVGDETAKLTAALDGAPESHLRITSSAQLHSMVAHVICTRGVTYSGGISKAWSNRETLLWSEPVLVHSAASRFGVEYTVKSLREFLGTRTFILMDDPVFVDHFGITGPLLEYLEPRSTRVIYNVAIMAVLCREVGNAIIIPAGLCQRCCAFNQSDISWTSLECLWSPVPVTMVENHFDQLEASIEIRDAIMVWADQERSRYFAV